jgi:hypothetical protein
MAPAAGASAAGSSAQIQFPGFLLDRGRYTAFEVAGAVTQTFPIGINDRGQIVGYYDDADGLHGFLRQKDGRFRTIDFPGRPRNRGPEDQQPRSDRGPLQ